MTYCNLPIKRSKKDSPSPMARKDSGRILPVKRVTVDMLDF
jgi:hypothetical protein